MRRARRACLHLVFAILLASILVATLHTRASDPPSQPKVRAITAFVRLDRANYQSQIQDALKFLRTAKAAIEKSGYEVEGIRITTQPFPEYTRGSSDDQALRFFRDYDALAVKEGFDAAIGPAMLKDSDDPHAAELLGKIITQSKILEGSVSIAGEDGIHWNSIHAAAGVIKYLEANTPHSQANFNFTAAAWVPSGTPFYPASYYTGEGKQFAIALQSANVVSEVLASTKSPAEAEERLKNVLGAHAAKIEKTAAAISEGSDWKYGGIDLSPAPLKDVSIGRAIENFLDAPVGSSGTLSTAALITRALKAIPVKQAGYSGLMLPILEDAVLAQRWSEGRLSIDALLAYSSVCGTGLDTIPMPGDVSQKQLEAILGDVASLSVKWHKPLSARLQPVVGKKAGDMTEFDDPFLVNAKIQPLP
ncbi:MAG TPA: DUF711 family protein [Candidatus Acidoferrales bacterium]|nr:DUF711 family protein [Candidatus Acidoferrales bacterium]